MAFTAIPNSSIDSDSPLDTTLFTYLRDNDDYLKALFHATTGHTHAGGGDSGAPIVVPDGSITNAKLGNEQITTNKVANGQITVLQLGWVQGSYTNASAGTYTVTVNRYGHQMGLNSPITSYVSQSAYTTGGGTTYQVRLTLDTAGSTTLYWDYHYS